MGQINGNWWPAANVRSRGQSTKFFYREGSATRSNFVPWPFINHFWHRKCSPCVADWNASEALLGFFTDRNDRIRYPFIYFNYRNPYAFIISLKLCTPFEIRSLPSQAILGCPPGSKSHTEYKFLSSLPNDITVNLHITGSISVLVTKQLKPAPQYKFMYHAPRSHGGVNFCSVSVACAASSGTSRHNKRCEPSLTQSSGQRTISVEGPSGLRLF